MRVHNQGNEGWRYGTVVVSEGVELEGEESRAGAGRAGLRASDTRSSKRCTRRLRGG
jgi:hypothetical protein